MVESYVTAWVFHARLLHSFREHDNFWYQIFSQGSVATYMQGVLGSSIITLLQIFWRICQWKILKIGQGLTDRITAMSLVSQFFGDTAYVTAGPRGIVVELQAVKVNRKEIPNKAKKHSDTAKTRQLLQTSLKRLNVHSGGFRSVKCIVFANSQRPTTSVAPTRST